MAQITYADKSAMNVNSSIPDTNKVNASDMNEIKSVVNANYNEYSNLLTGLVYTEVVNLATNLSVNANSNTATANYTLTPRANYTPILVTTNNMWNGAISMWYCNLSGNTISWRVRNNSSSNATGLTIQVRVLYIKSSCVAA